MLDSDTINKKGVAQFENLVTTLENDKFVIAPTQSSAEAVLSAQYTTSWNGTLTHVMNITFGSADLQRHFFNAGGEVRMASNITYTGTSSKTLDWMTMLVNMGTVKMGYTGTTATGSGSGSAIGYHDLTSSYQQIFIKNGTGLYAANNYKVEAKKTSGTVLTFRLTWNDDNTGNPKYRRKRIRCIEQYNYSNYVQQHQHGTGVEVAITYTQTVVRST